jgi:hypothetical protein
LVEDETVRRNSTTRLASRVLRNIWLRSDDDDFEAFRHEIERAWPTISVRKPERVRMIPPFVQMFYSENRIEREVQWAGFGFQVWLQIQTHLRRGTQDSVLIIDEPDIYLHPDLQRRLLRDIAFRYHQFVLATHSVEIINEAQANDIVSINADNRIGRRIKTDEDYATLYNYLGSTDNADIARITRARRVIFVEGQERRLIRRLASRFGLAHLADAQSTPIVPLGGFSEWRRATHAVWAFREVLDLDIKTFCIFDRDYRCDEEVKDFQNTAEIDFQLHVFGRKEIENYWLEPETIRRAVGSQMRAKKVVHSEPTIEQINEWLIRATEKLRYQVQSQLIAHRIRHAESRGTGLDQSTLIRDTTAQFDLDWSALPYRLRCAPGKEVLAR